MKRRILVCGGAGYIGSETVAALLSHGYEVVVYDSLENGHSQSLPQHEDVRLVTGRIEDRAALDQVMAEGFDGVIDFAAYLQVGESVTQPLKYFRNNVAGTLSVLESMVAHNVKHIVFSSSAAVYGNPERVPIAEQDRKEPTNPYGQTKLMVEQMLKWAEPAHGLTSVCLRYFNAAGAALDGSRGEAHKVESHLIPLVLAAALGQRDKITIFGQDYKTPDGTCVRDYIHITDLASAHILALEYLMKGGATMAVNVGTGNGYSNRQLVDMAKQITGVDFAVEYGERREGDPDELIASSHKLQQELGWKAEHSDLATILGTAWEWHRRHPDGYADEVAHGG